MPGCMRGPSNPKAGRGRRSLALRELCNQACTSQPHRTKPLAGRLLACEPVDSAARCTAAPQCRMPVHHTWAAHKTQRHMPGSNENTLLPLVPHQQPRCNVTQPSPQRRRLLSTRHRPLPPGRPLCSATCAGSPSITTTIVTTQQHANPSRTLPYRPTACVPPRLNLNPPCRPWGTPLPHAPLSPPPTAVRTATATPTTTTTSR